MEGHDVAIIGTISSYFIWVMFAVAVIVLVNPIACKKRKSDNKVPILWLVFGLFTWVLNLFIIGIEFYVGFLLSFDKLISINTFVELSDSIISIPAVAYLSCE